MNLPEEGRHNKALLDALEKMDINANVNWPLMHMGSAYRYLNKENAKIEATGGTNWKDYLPPSFQKVVFFPKIHSNEALNNWGKQWVDHIFNPRKNRRLTMQKYWGALLAVILLISCNEDKPSKKAPELATVEGTEELKEMKEFGFNLQDFTVVQDTIKNGDSLWRNHVGKQSRLSKNCTGFRTIQRYFRCQKNTRWPTLSHTKI